ncbi:hypothetical protein K523DRAFT_409039, partial [Schizophyllum commune Tattone D]
NTQDAAFPIITCHFGTCSASASHVTHVPLPSAYSQLPPPPVAGAPLRVLTHRRLLTNPAPAARPSACTVPSDSQRLNVARSRCLQYILLFDTTCPLISATPRRPCPFFVCLVPPPHLHLPSPYLARHCSRHFLGCLSLCLASPRSLGAPMFLFIWPWFLFFFGKWCLIFEGLGRCNMTVTSHIPRLYKAGLILL